MLEKLPAALGHALQHRRAGLEETLYHRTDLRQGLGAITVGSLAFTDHAPIPEVYTADGDGHSPPLHWSGVPPGTQEVLLLVEDADAPTSSPLVHAIVTGLPGEDGALAEGAIDAAADQEDGEPEIEGEVGRNSFLRRGWLPPDPPPGHGPHRYVFQVLALGAGAGKTAALKAGAGRDDVEAAVRERAVASGCLVGIYERGNTRVRNDEPAVAKVPAMPAAEGGGIGPGGAVTS